MTETSSKYLLMALHTHYYAIELPLTLAVEDPPKLWTIPNSHPPCCGAMNFHNTIVAVFDLAATLGYPPASNPDKIIILDPKIAALAFLVERVMRISSHDTTDLGEPPAVACVKNILTIPEGEAYLLDIDALTAIASDAFHSKPDSRSQS